jgi:hypothetical protein
MGFDTGEVIVIIFSLSVFGLSTVVCDYPLGRGEFENRQMGL